MVHFNDYFYGNKISDYGMEHGFVDYATLAKSFNAVLNNEIMQQLESNGFYFEQESGFADNSEKIEELREKIEELESKKDDFEEYDNEYADILEEIEELENEIEELESEQDNTPEIYQFYIVDDNGARILEEFNEIVFYCSEIDMYIWGVTHYGTSWDYVLTNIPCGKNN